MLTILLPVLHVSRGDQAADKIIRLPGQPLVSFDQYAGYVTVNQTEGRALFYWLTEANRQNSSKLPLVLWLNGGPGCSSIGLGASAEIGPFRIHKDGSSLYLNEYSWNRFANLLFVESPAGVGFSYTNTSSNLLDSGDNRTAEDALAFLINWFQRFPQYKYREFYLCGESYAGHYVPQLAQKVYKYNQGNSNPFINLKGYMVGNAQTDDYYDSVGTVQYWWSHTLISDSTYNGLVNNCDFRVLNFSSACNNYIAYAMQHEFGNIDPYSIYTPTCTQAIGDRRFASLKKSMARKLAGSDTCVENYANIYYNRPDVQRALHANTTHIPYNWTICSATLFNHWTDTEFTILPIYKELIAAGLRIWIFSGDTDSYISVTGTRLTIGQLNLPITIPWYPWYSNNQTVGGWTEVYKGLTFATVRGAGHEVPLFQPQRALKLFRSFLLGHSLPSSIPSHN
jgi:serine carboxypeptidase-like clade 2